MLEATELVIASTGAGDGGFENKGLEQGSL